MTADEPLQMSIPPTWRIHRLLDVVVAVVVTVVLVFDGKVDEKRRLLHRRIAAESLYEPMVVSVAVAVAVTSWLISLPLPPP